MSNKLTGVFLARNGPSKLESIYKKIFIISEKLPKDAAYKQNLEATIGHRLSVVKMAKGDRKIIEDNIRCGTLEMLIVQAEDEFKLLQKMLLFKVWEPLMEQPPPGQWNWPPAL